tara:strand:+ start:448 stop:654 length:207 start_codon:yes stop_codon:yes gene_type:complete
MFEWVNKGLKRLKWFDMSLVKLSIAAFVLFIITFLSTNVMDKIRGLRWLWLAIFIIAVIIPMSRMFKK